MPSLPRRAWLLLTAAVHVHSVAALTIPPPHKSLFLLFDRAPTCSASGFAPCTNGDFPDDFCCQAGATCNALAANTTIVCCPSGTSCSVLEPISCDISLQDASLHPSASVKTTALNGALPQCGGGCCPFGYSCSTNKCIVNANQNASPIQTAVAQTSTAVAATSAAVVASATSAATSATSAATTSATSAAAATSATSATTSATTSSAGTTSTPATSIFFSSLTSTTSSTVSPTAGTAGNASANESAVASADDNSGKSTSTPSIVGGVIGGVAGLAVVGATVWFILGRRLRRSGTPAVSRPDTASIGERKQGRSFFAGGSNESTTSFGFGHIINNPLAISISSPKPQGNTTAYRTDFIRRPGTAASGSALLAPANAAAAGASSPVYASPYDNYGSTYAPHDGAPSISPPTSTSPFSVSIPSTPTPAPLSSGGSGSRRDSIPPIRGMRAQVRQPSTTGEINIGADPSLLRAGGGHYAMGPDVNMNANATTTTSPDTMREIANAALAASNGNLGAPPADPHRLTSFSSLMAAANLDQSRPFVPR